MRKSKIGTEKGEIEMEKRNYSLRILQAAYLKVTLKKQQRENEEVCLYCWKSNGCKCNVEKGAIKNDPFINLSTTSEYVY
jgi:hypothetical protein